MSEREIIWNLPNECAIVDRIEELQIFIERFPDSKLVPVFQNAIKELESKL